MFPNQNENRIVPAASQVWQTDNQTSPGKAPDLPLVESIPSPWTGKPHNIGVTWWPGIRLPGPLHLIAVQSTSYWTPIAPPVGGGSTEEQTHIASLS